MNRFDGSDSCPTKICITPSKTSAAMVIVCNCLRPLKKPEREISFFTSLKFIFFEAETLLLPLLSLELQKRSWQN
jgi:hypothetical protein